MVGVVASAVGEVDAADERDVVLGARPVPDDDELLVMRAQRAHPVVEQHLPARVVDLLGQLPVLLGREAEAPGVRSPQDPSGHGAPASGAGQRFGDGGSRGAEPLVRVGAPAGEQHEVAGTGVLERLGEDGEVGAPVHQGPRCVAGGPSRQVRGLVAALLPGEQPVESVHGFGSGVHASAGA